MGEISLKGLLEAGVHFGHQCSRWNPRMKPFLFTARNGIHIIDLEQTVPMLHKAYHFVLDQVARGGTVLFVGTKPQAQEVIIEESARTEMPYVVHRWLGGMLTNYKTIKQSIDRMRSYQERKEKGELAKLTKKEQLMLERESIKMERSFGGIRNMEQLPAVVVVVDPNREHIAQAEANRLKIPVVALADSNCNPKNIDFLIPGNDDAMRAIKVVISHLADACMVGRERRQEVIRAEVENREKLGKEKTAANPRAQERKMTGPKPRAYVGKEKSTNGEAPAAPVVEIHTPPTGGVQ